MLLMFVDGCHTQNSDSVSHQWEVHGQVIDVLPRDLPQ